MTNPSTYKRGVMFDRVYPWLKQVRLDCRDAVDRGDEGTSVDVRVWYAASEVLAISAARLAGYDAWSASCSLSEGH